MKTIYIWLLENTGNEGHYYTILNTHRKNDSGEGYLEIMARRTDDFTVVNLVVFNKQAADVPDANGTGQVVASYLFSDEQQVIDYIANGTEAQGSASETTEGIQVLVVKPTGEAGSITFPHEQ